MGTNRLLTRTRLAYVNFIHRPFRAWAGGWRLAHSDFTLGVDAAKELVMQFMDLIAARGQRDLVAGAKISYDGAAILVGGGKQDYLRLEQELRNEEVWRGLWRKSFRTSCTQPARGSCIALP